MRGWVGVQNEKGQKSLYARSIQEFESNGTFKPSAHLMGTRFQRFVSCVMTIPCVMICSFAQPYLENQIAINQNTY